MVVVLAGVDWREILMEKDGDGGDNYEQESVEGTGSSVREMHLGCLERKPTLQLLHRSSLVLPISGSVRHRQNILAFP